LASSFPEVSSKNERLDTPVSYIDAIPHLIYSMLKFQRKSHSSSNVLVVSSAFQFVKKSPVGVLCFHSPYLWVLHISIVLFICGKYLCWIRKKIISLGTKPLMEMEDGIQYLRSYRPESKSNPFASN
jgi:hypothetical protein